MVGGCVLKMTFDLEEASGCRRTLQRPVLANIPSIHAYMDGALFKRDIFAASVVVAGRDLSS